VSTETLRVAIGALAGITLRLKRDAFDAGYQTTHNKLAEAEALIRQAQRDMLADPPIDSPLRTGAPQ
jgi:hypothetical protein